MGANAGINRCSTGYKAGVATEIAAEIAVTGASVGLRHAAAKITDKAARSAGGKYLPKAVKGMIRHHINPLHGHPGGAKSLLPTAGLPAWLHSGKANIRLVTVEQHARLHRRLRVLESASAVIVNPVTTTARGVSKIGIGLP